MTFHVWPLVDLWPWWVTLTSDAWPWPLTLRFDLGTHWKLSIYDVEICDFGPRYPTLNSWPSLVTFDLWLTFDLGEWPWPLMNDLDPWPWNLTLAQNWNSLFLKLTCVKLTLAIGYWTFTYDLSCLTFGWPLTLVSDVDLWCMTLTPDLEIWPWHTLEIIYLRCWNMWFWP